MGTTLATVPPALGARLGVASLTGWRASRAAGKAAGYTVNLDVRVLGPIEVGLDGSVADLGSPKQRAVLALLAATAPQSVSVDRLVEDVWEGNPPPRPMGSLQAYVSNLRRALEPGRAAGSPATVLVTAPPGYALRLKDELDWVRFERDAARGHDLLAAGDAGAARTALARALELWRGDRAFADIPITALEPEVARLTEVRLLATEDLWAAELLLGRHGVAAPELRRLCVEYPLRERLWELLIVALYRSGHQAEALDKLREVRDRLADELGIDPGPALRTLETDILRQAPHLDPQAVTPVRSVAAALTGPAPDPADVLIGRDAAVATLTAALASARAGRGSIVVVAGEPGIGKSRLLREVTLTAAGHRLAIVGGVAEDQPPWHAWRSIVDQLGVPAPELPDGDADPDRVRWAMIQAIRSAFTEPAGPLTIVVDDLQWMDAASLQVLAAIADDVAWAPVCVVTAVREPTADTDGPLAQALAALARAGGTRVTLARLDLAQTRDFAEAVAGHDLTTEAVAALHQRTGGNPLFLRETVRLLTAPGGLAPVPAEQVPAGVRDLVRLRVAALPDDARTVLSVAAVVGQEVDLAVLARVCGLDPERTLDLVDVAVVHGVLEEDPAALGRVRFGHALVREAMLADLPPNRRSSLHLRIADDLDESGGPAASLAYHLERAAARRADVVARAVAAAEQAAVEASRRGAPLDAATWRARALDLAATDSALPDQRRYELLVALAAARSEASDVPGARSAMLDAVTLAEAMGDERLVAEALVAYGTATATIWPGPFPDPIVLERLHRNAERLDRLDDTLKSRLLSCLAAETAKTSDIVATREISERSIVVAREAGDPRLLAQILGAHIVATWAADTVSQRIDAALELAALPVGPVAEATGRWYAGVSMLELGQRRQGQLHIDRSRQLADRLGLPGLLAQQAWFTAARQLMDGDLDDAEAATFTATALHRSTGMWGAEESMASQLFSLRDEQGRLPELVATLTAVAEAGMPGLTEGIALALLRAGDLPGAEAALARAFAEPPVPAWGLVHSWAVRAEVTAAVGTEAQVAEATRVLAPHSGRVAVAGTGVVCRGAVDRTLGLLAERRGDLPEAEQRLRAAILLDDAGDLRIWAAYARVALARVLRAIDPQRDGEPRALLDQAALVAERGLPRLTEAVARERGR